MYGFTGTWQGRPVSVQGSGMGQPSMSIYLHELFTEYDVESIVRVGSCGADSERLAIRDVVIASGACTDAGTNRITFEGLDYAPVADFGLLRSAVEVAERRETEVHVGSAVLHRLLLQRAARPGHRGWPATASSRSTWSPPPSTRSRPSTGGGR